MRKTVIQVALLSVAMLLLAGCQGQGSPAPGGSSTADQTKPDTQAQQPAAKYPERNITFIVPAGAGGGMDLYARVLSPLMEKHLPNKVNIIVKNVEGAGTVIGSTEVFRADPDGYTIGNHQIPGLVVNQVMGKAKYDLSQYTWLGRMQNDVYITVVGNKSRIKSVEDLKTDKGPVKIGVAGISTSSGLTLMITTAVTGWPIEIIPHNGFSDASVAAIRGDIDGLHFPYSTVRSYIEQGELRPLVVYSDQRLSDLPDIPTIAEAGWPDLTDAVQTHVMVAGPPGLPPDVTKALQDALTKAMNDPEAVKWSKETKRPLAPMDPAKADAFIKNMIKIYSQYKDIFAQFM